MLHRLVTTHSGLATVSPNAIRNGNINVNPSAGGCGDVEISAGADCDPVFVLLRKPAAPRVKANLFSSLLQIRAS